MAAPSTAERDWVYALLRQAAPTLSDEDLARLPPFSKTELAAGQFLLRAGEQASVACVIADGALREYYLLEDGSEVTRNFALRGSFAGSLSDLLSGEPARVNIRAEQPTTLLTLPWQHFRDLAGQSLNWAMFARQQAEMLYLEKAQREYELLVFDATARYRSALQRWPGLEGLFSQRDIASYVGITPVHLSRLRSRLGRS